MEIFTKHKKRWLILSILLVFVVFWSFLLYFFSPSDIINLIGVQNSYVVIFLVALIGGLSSFTTAGSYTPALIIFSLGGSNPLLLGLVGGIALTLGDSLYYIIGRQSRRVVKKKYSLKIESIIDKYYRKNEYLGLFSIYIYAAFTPLPNDFITFPSGLGRISSKKFLVVLFLGNVTQGILIAELAYLLGPYVL